MTFARMLILAITTAVMVHVTADTEGEVIYHMLLTSFVAYVAWSFTSDPLPSAIESGLDAYAKKWRGQ
jgi:hypothetical protein